MREEHSRMMKRHVYIEREEHAWETRGVNNICQYPSSGFELTYISFLQHREK